jgi:hypothetical protein
MYRGIYAAIIQTTSFIALFICARLGLERDNPLENYKDAYIKMLPRVEILLSRPFRACIFSRRFPGLAAWANIGRAYGAQE